MTTDQTPTTRYRNRVEEIEAIQWTGSNADQLRVFCGPDFDTIDPEDRVDDPNQDAQLLSDASHWVGIKPTDWVLKFDGYFVAKSDVPFRAVWEPAVPSAAETANRAALLREAADVAREEAHRLETGNHDARAARGARSAAYLLRRLAEAPQPETEATPLPFIHTDDDGDQLAISAVMASTYDGEAPVVAVNAEQHGGDQQACVYVRPERVEQVVTALRTARQAAEAMPAVVAQPGEEG
ncbi:hypothetical protein QBA54_07570 [Streptomyces sp. B21-108]|uniref:hypothetical protein n=1 Tax=Streptomyces sp. B21-108 TaxID=3039419 RepID=UPI002FF35370